MKILILSLVVVLLLHYPEGVPTGQKRKNPFRLDEALFTKTAKNILRNLTESGLIQPNRQVAFLLLGDKTQEYFDSLTVNPDGTFISKDHTLDDNKFDNFLIAEPMPFDDPSTWRPGKQHAEILLLEELLGLSRHYKDKHGHPPQFLLLYSDILPCEVCTAEIIQEKLKGPLPKMDWFVVYRRTQSARKDYASGDNIGLMEENGIEVYKLDDSKRKKTKYLQ